MSKITSPPEKKRLAYDRDHVTPAEYPHAFRKLWPRKKARAERAARRSARQVLKTTGDDAATASIRREQVQKWGSVTAREIMRLKREKRHLLARRKAR